MAKTQNSRERFPELYVPKSHWVDPHTRGRNVPMRVLCLYVFLDLVPSMNSHLEFADMSREHVDLLLPLFFL